MFAEVAFQGGCSNISVYKNFVQNVLISGTHGTAMASLPPMFLNVQRFSRGDIHFVSKEFGNIWNDAIL